MYVQRKLVLGQPEFALTNLYLYATQSQLILEYYNT